MDRRLKHACAPGSGAHGLRLLLRPRRQVAEVTAQNEYQLKLKDLLLNEKVRELTDKAASEAAEAAQRWVQAPRRALGPHRAALHLAHCPGRTRRLGQMWNRFPALH